MAAALGLTGWGLAVAGFVAVVVLHVRMSRMVNAVTHACHELRGPLTAARLGLELGSAIPRLRPDRIRAIELELSRATLALDDLAAVRMGDRTVRREAVDLVAVAAESVEAWRAAAHARGVALRLDRPGAPLCVSGERLRLAQAIGNLIANAIEHGGGEVLVRLQEQRGEVRLEVMDEGPGLPAPIERLCAARGPSWGGRPPERGHGLAIVSGIASAHGGRLAAAPSDRGARLVLELPAADPKAAYLDASVRL